MAKQKKSLSDCSFEELDRELIARGARVPAEERYQFVDKEGTPTREDIMEQTKALYRQDRLPFQDESLSHLDIWDLVEELLRRIKKAEDENLGIWGEDNRMDYHQLVNEQVKKNADCVAAICRQRDLIESSDWKGFSVMKHKSFGKTFNLCDYERFYNQPTASGPLCTGFLVKDNVIATAAHCTDEENVTDLRIVFGFNISDPHTPATQVPNEKIYKGVKIINRVYDPNGSGADWALVELDRCVEDQSIAVLSKESIAIDQPIYTLGHPCGLPLKYSAGAQVRRMNKACFAANLDVYSGNSGSPVFNYDTHKVIGIAVRGDGQDFRWTGRGWLSITYPTPSYRSMEPQCTKVSEFIEYCNCALCRKGKNNGRNQR